MSVSIDVVFILFQRKACADNVIHSIRETYMFSQWFYVSNGEEMTSYYLKYCESLENKFYEKIFKERPTYLELAYPVIDSMENGQFCDIFYTDPNATITSANCKSFMNGISQTGLTNILQMILNIGHQLMIDYPLLLSQYNGKIPGNVMVETVYKIRNHFDVMQMLMNKPFKAA